MAKNDRIIHEGKDILNLDQEPGNENTGSDGNDILNLGNDSQKSEDGHDIFNLEKQKKESKKQEIMQHNLKMKNEHPLIYALAKQMSQVPGMPEELKRRAKNPVVEGALSGRQSLINSFINMANAIPETFGRDKLVENVERGYPEPKEGSGKWGSLAGHLTGAGIGFAASPFMPATLPGALLTGYMQTEGAPIERSVGAGLAGIFPSLGHLFKFGKSMRDVSKQKKLIENIGRETEGAKQNLDESQLQFAQDLSQQRQPELFKQESTAENIKQKAGISESEAKQDVASKLKKLQKDRKTDYSNKYEDFNNSESGQKLVDEPLSFKDMKKQYGLEAKDLSKETQKLMEKTVGKTKTTEPSAIVSSETGKPLIEGGEEFTDAKPKVADYIKFWKQLRSEASNYYKAASRATTATRTAAVWRPTAARSRCSTR